MVFSLCFVLFLIGIYCIMVKRNLIKIIIGLNIVEYAINLFLILFGYKKDGVAPIITSRDLLDAFIKKTVDPIPQALVLTSIVIGLGVLALSIAIAVRLYHKYGTFDVNEMRRLKG